MIKKPHNPNFSSGPCVKFPEWKADFLQDIPHGRSHRSETGLKFLLKAYDLTRQLLKLPNDYLIGMVPGSTTSAIETLLWNLLGARDVTSVSWDVFSEYWRYDIVEQLKIKNVTEINSPYGQVPSLDHVWNDNDVVFSWNGTTTGTCLPHTDWIPHHREGLVISDITSAIFTTNIEWEKLDAAAFSWQKGVGSEAGQGMIILSPRAVERIKSYTPSWPIPRVFNLKKDGLFKQRLFTHAEVVNTPSLMAVGDYIYALEWALSIGGIKELIHRCDQNFHEIESFVQQSKNYEFLIQDPLWRSHSSVCIVPKVPADFSKEETWSAIVKICQLLSQNEVAYDIKGHALSEPCIRIWCGPTVDQKDIQLLMPWLDWAYHQVF